MVVLHSTGGPTCDANGNPVWVTAGALKEDVRNIESHPRLGIHYMIDRDGTVVASVPEAQVAHHVFSFSERSIGVELVNDGDGVDRYPVAQLSALVSLLRQLTRKYAIGRSGIVRHSDLDRSRMPCAPTRRRKTDPGAAFPYEEVLRRTFAAAP
jgi:N-acetyl-anhydromuramyl-L-alanine amidase AmpD